MKKLIFTLVLLLSPLFSFAGTTVISGVIQDPNGQVFAGGTCQFQFQPTPGVPGPYTSGGLTFPTQPVCLLDGSGNIAGVVTDNLTIDPAGSKWMVTVCPNASVPCTSNAFVITGVSENISAFINNVIPVISLPPLVATPRAYLDSQVTPINQGSSYWNTSKGVQRFWNGSIWVSSSLIGIYKVDGLTYPSVESAILACIASTNVACWIDGITSGQYGVAADVIWSNTGTVLDPGGKAITLQLGGYKDYVSANSIVVETGLTIVGNSGALPNSSNNGTAITFTNPLADAFILSSNSNNLHPQNVRFQNFVMYGAGTGTQNGLSFDCTAIAGGIDASLFENLTIRNFAGDAIHLPCSKYNGVGNNQNTVFSNIQAFRVPNSGGYALYASGNTGNILFLNGHLKPDPLIAPGTCDTGTSVYIGSNNIPIAPLTITSFSATNGILTATYTGAPVTVVANQVNLTLSGFTSGYGITNLNGQVASVITVTGQSGTVPPYSGTITATLGTVPPNTTTVADTGSGAFNNGTFNPNSIHFIGTTVEGGSVLVNLNGASNIDFIGTHHEACPGTTNGFLFTAGGSGNRTINMRGLLFLAVGTGTNGYIFNTNASGSNQLTLNVSGSTLGTPVNVLIGNTNTNQNINIDNTNVISVPIVTTGYTQTASAPVNTNGTILPPNVKDISVQGNGAISGISGNFMPTQPFTLRQTGTWKIYQSSTTEAAAVGTTYACSNNVCVLSLHNQINDPGVGGTITSVDASVNGQTTYHGTFPSGWAFNTSGLSVDIIGLVNSGNNGHFPVVSMSGVTLVVTNGSGVAEINPGNSYLETIFATGTSFGSSCIGFNLTAVPIVATTPTTVSVYTGAVVGSGTCGANGGTLKLKTNITLGGLQSVTPSNAQALEMRLNDNTNSFECVNCNVVGSTVTSPFSFISSTTAGGANYASTVGVLYPSFLPDGVTPGSATCSQSGIATGGFDPATGLPTMKASMWCEDSVNVGLYLWQTDKAILTGNTLVPIAGSSWVSSFNTQYNSGTPFTALPANSTMGGSTILTTANAVQIVAKIDTAGLTADVSSPTQLLASGSNVGGWYEVSGYIVVTTAAGTSSTFPAVQLAWTDEDTSQSNTVSFTTAGSGNAVGTSSSPAVGVNTRVFHVKSATAINYKTTGYASVPANAMVFSLHIVLRYLGA